MVNLRLTETARESPDVSGAVTDLEADVNILATIKVFGNRLTTDIFDIELCQGIPVEREFTQVIREDQCATRRQTIHRHPDQVDMIALNIQHAFHTFGV